MIWIAMSGSQVVKVMISSECVSSRFEVDRNTIKKAGAACYASERNFREWDLHDGILADYPMAWTTLFLRGPSGQMAKSS